MPLIRSLVLLAFALTQAAAAQTLWVPPHERPLTWDEADLAQRGIPLRDSVWLTFDLPAFLVSSAGWKRQERHHADCVGGHWTLDALRAVRLYERRGLTLDDHYRVPDQHLFSWAERPLFCIEPATRLRDGDTLWAFHHGDTLAVVAARTALDRCAPDGDPGFRCSAPEIVDRFTNAQGVEVVGVTARYIQGYDAMTPAPDAHAIGPFYLARSPSPGHPVAFFMPRRIAGWVPEEAMLRPAEVAFMQHLLQTTDFVTTDFADTD